ncbi:hypothetical protein RclHR1_18010004 [Rhizophagus clarus]|uniref:RNA-dependent RNA polymerase n=1 Tax=Rhizophagus clarus TaxID=94130 RepID=A0A2Z6REP4_9GLOM|nr:hypothetical protein RclHR1_18010004 [Rhizophagus clarus]
MGDYLQSGTFVSEAKFTQSVEFTINHQRRKIIVEFAAKEYQEKIRMFKLEINFKDLMNDIYSELDASQRRSRGSITIENKYPAKYWVLDESKKPKDRFNWCINDTWKRITEINTSNNDNEIPLFHQNNEQPVNGLSLVPRTSDISNTPLKIVNGSGHKHFNSFLYYLNNLLESLDILEGIYSRKKWIFDPLSYLRSELKNVKHEIEIQPRSYCGMVRKIVVASTTSYIITPTIETSNRVIRYFRDKKDHFLRVQFVDEALGKVGSSNDTVNLALYDKVYYTLHHGITIGDRHYEFLAFSASQLRDHSCWFFHQPVI